MFHLKTLLAGAAAAAALAGAANAAIVTVRDNPDNGGSVFGTGLGRTVTVDHNGAERTVGAGAFSLQYGANGQWTDFLTFCLELSERLTLPKPHEEVDGDSYFTDAGDRTALEILYGSLMTPDLGLRSATSAAAMQTIIWEIVEDGAASFDLRSGSFSVETRDVRREANRLWALLLTGEYKPVRFDVLTAPGTQDLLVAEVPAPAAALLFGTAIAGLGFARRKRKG